MKVVSARGLTIDMSKYMNENPEQIALGNAKMNARGDIIGRGGKVEVKAEEISAQYHRANPNATVVRQVALKDLSKEVFQTPAEAVAAATAAQAKVQAPVAEPAKPPAKKRKLSDDE